MRSGFVAPAALIALAAFAPGPLLAGEKGSRADLETMEAILDDAVSRVSRPSVHVVLGGREAARGYRLKGVGAIFVLPPRSLPGPERNRVFVFRGPDRPGGARRLSPDQERELQAIQIQLDSLQHEAEQAQQEAERAFENLERNVRVRSVQRVADSAGAPPPPEPAAPPRPPVAPDVLPPGMPPPPPWRFWFPEESRDERAPDKVVADVKAAVIAALESHGARLGTIPADESVLVAIDFLPPRGFDLEPPPPGEQSLVIRVKKRDLVEARSGKISADELRRRIDATEY
jgi:hypothetical protein